MAIVNVNCLAVHSMPRPGRPKEAVVTARPHDVTDLYLAPVALGVDQRLEELSGLSAEDVQFRVILDTNREPRSATDREKALIESLTSGLDLRGWQVSRHPRGLLLSHDTHSLVLGIPSNVVSYLDA